MLTNRLKAVMPASRASAVSVSVTGQRSRAASCTSALKSVRWAVWASVRGLCTCVGRERRHQRPFHK